MTRNRACPGRGNAGLLPPPRDRGRHGGRIQTSDPTPCLINRYGPRARLSLHQDKNERDFANPIVSTSLGLPATFQFGGLKRADPVKKYALRHGDVAVWGGPSRLCYHGVAVLKDGEHPKVGRVRINLTFRGAL